MACFCVVCSGNVWCLWRNVRHKEHHSLIPIVGGVCGFLGLLILFPWVEAQFEANFSLWYFALPFVLDVGMLLVVASILITVYGKLRTRLFFPHF